jgi:hypothetical protein
MQNTATELEKQTAAKSLLSAIANEFGATVGNWEESPAIGLWHYADLTLGDETIRVGASGGGVVSIDRKSHDPAGRVNDCLDAIIASFVATFPRQALIDKFHVVKMANEAVEKGRKDLRSKMNQGQIKQLKKDRYLMLKRRRDLDATQEFLLSGWTANFPELDALYHAKERFFDIWDSDLTRPEAEAAYGAWKDAIPSEIRGYFSDLARAVDNWRIEVFNYFDHRITNAYTESANNHIKSIAKQGRGYSFDVLRARVLFIGAKHKIRPKPFKHGIAEKTIGYALPDDLFINYGVEFQHEAENS